ncbi:uncharacterized protein [Equus caballus]|uniref:uncharacterized protein n=1 Tax=Equus caballus TaxID=9796 RepID=UPI0038B3B5E5
MDEPTNIMLSERSQTQKITQRMAPFIWNTKNSPPGRRPARAPGAGAAPPAAIPGRGTPGEGCPRRGGGRDPGLPGSGRPGPARALPAARGATATWARPSARPRPVVAEGAKDEGEALYLWVDSVGLVLVIAQSSKRQNHLPKGKHGRKLAEGFVLMSREVKKSLEVQRASHWLFIMGRRREQVRRAQLLKILLPK